MTLRKALALQVVPPLALLAGILLASPSNAADYPRDLTLSWVNASQYVDGTEIEAGDLIGVQIACNRTSGEAVVGATFAPTGEGLAQTETFLAAIPRPGTYICVGYSIVVGDISSDASEPASQKYVGKPFPIKEVTFQ